MQTVGGKFLNLLELEANLPGVDPYVALFRVENKIDEEAHGGKKPICE